MRPESKTTGTARKAQSAASAQPDDETLAAYAAEGDASAFETLVLRFQDRVYNLLCRLCGSESEAEDLAQETFMKAYRALPQFRQGSKFYTWIFRIAVNTSYSRGRQTVRRQRREGVSLDAPAKGNGDEGGSLRDSAPAGEDAAPEAALETEQLRLRVREGLEQLDPDQRTVVLLRDMEGLDYEAIAESLGITRAAVKSRLHRARLELARILKDLKPEGSGQV